MWNIRKLFVLPAHHSFTTSVAHSHTQKHSHFSRCAHRQRENGTRRERSLSFVRLRRSSVALKWPPPLKRLPTTCTHKHTLAHSDTQRWKQLGVTVAQTITAAHTTFCLASAAHTNIRLSVWKSQTNTPKHPTSMGVSPLWKPRLVYLAASHVDKI